MRGGLYFQWYFLILFPVKKKEEKKIFFFYSYEGGSVSSSKFSSSSFQKRRKNEKYSSSTSLRGGCSLFLSKFSSSSCKKIITKKNDQNCECCQNCEGSLTENSCSCYKVCGKPENSCSGYCDVCKESQYKRRCPHCYYITTEAELQPIYRFLRARQQNTARDVSPQRT